MDYFLPEKVNFDRGFGYKYQYLLATLIIHLIENYDKFFVDGKLIYLNFSNIVSLLNINNIHVNLKKTLKDLNEIVNYSKAIYNENTLIMLEGHSKYFEDINIFDNTTGLSNIIFLQIKGGDKDGDSPNFNATIKSAINNFMKNENVEKIENFTFIILSNAINFEKHFLNKTNEDKKSLISYLIQESINENFLEINLNVENCKSLLINNIFKRSKRNRYFKSNKDLDWIKDIKKKHADLYKRLNKIILTINKLKVMNTLDFRVIIYLLSEFFEEKKFYQLLWKVELQSMERENLTESEMKDKISELNFDKSVLDKIKFIEKSDNSKIKYGKIF